MVERHAAATCRIAWTGEPCRPRVAIAPVRANAAPKSPHRPLRVMFMQTDMRIGGAEMVTANIIRRLDRERFLPELCCLKELGEIGEALAGEIPVHHGLLAQQV